MPGSKYTPEELEARGDGKPPKTERQKVTPTPQKPRVTPMAGEAIVNMEHVVQCLWALCEDLTDYMMHAERYNRFTGRAPTEHIKKIQESRASVAKAVEQWPALQQSTD